VSIVYEGRVFSVEVLSKRLPSGKEHEVAIVRHAPSVVIVPLTENGDIVLIRQFRASVDRILWEVPAGRVNPGESPEDGARRECEEEIALVPGRVERLAALYPAPGFCDELLIFFKASDLRPPAPDSTHHPDEDEEIESHVVSIADAKAMVARGEIEDLKTAYALSLL
jgi:ADP-ribose pyrophosphatase